MTNAQTDKDKLQELVKAVMDYQSAIDRAVEGGHDGGDVYEAEEAWKNCLALAGKFKEELAF